MKYKNQESSEETRCILKPFTSDRTLKGGLSVESQIAMHVANLFAKIPS
jgi:hypothetical protein